MTLQTSDGIRFFCLPENACCLCTGVSPENMDECPLRKFDHWGDVCVPEECENYTENNELFDDVLFVDPLL